MPVTYGNPRQNSGKKPADPREPASTKGLFVAKPTEHLKNPAPPAKKTIKSSAKFK